MWTTGKHFAKRGMGAWSAAPRTSWWGLGGLAAGALLGALLMLLILLAVAPHPAPAAPVSGKENGNLSITMDDAYLSQVVASAIKGASPPITLRDVQTEIQPGNRVKITARTDGSFPIGAQLTAVGQLAVESGRLVMHVMSATVGGLALPAGLAHELEAPVNSQLAEVSAFLVPPHLNITALSTTEHHLRMTISRG
jgi:hypothetical protein